MPWLGRLTGDIISQIKVDVLILVDIVGLSSHSLSVRWLCFNTQRTILLTSRNPLNPGSEIESKQSQAVAVFLSG